MKEYKLIKEYPGSPSLGTTTKQLFYLGNDWLNHLHKFPELWEEIEEKTYTLGEIAEAYKRVAPVHSPLFFNFMKSLVDGK